MNCPVLLNPLQYLQTIITTVTSCLLSLFSCPLFLCPQDTHVIYRCSISRCRVHLPWYAVTNPHRHAQQDSCTVADEAVAATRPRRHELQVCSRLWVVDVLVVEARELCYVVCMCDDPTKQR